MLFLSLFIDIRISHRLCAVSVLGPPLMYITALVELRKLRHIYFLPLLLLVGYGIAANNAIAVIRGLFDATGQSGVFVRTPKIGVEAGKKRAKLMASMRTLSLAYVELAVLSYLVVALWLVGTAQPGTFAIFLIFVIAYALAAVLGIFVEDTTAGA